MFPTLGVYMLNFGGMGHCPKVVKKSHAVNATCNYQEWNLHPNLDFNEFFNNDNVWIQYELVHEISNNVAF